MMVSGATSVQPASNAMLTASHSRPSTFVPRRHPAPVLLIDDDQAVRNSLKWLLELEGFKVIPAVDGGAGLDLLRRGLRPCIILLDLGMPGIDGRTFRKLQLEDPAIAAIPVIVYSGHASGEDDMPGTIHLMKPFDAEKVIECVTEHCEKV